MIKNDIPEISSVLIIGNGFDKSCGLKTGYQDVYDEYIITPSPNKLISDFKKSIITECDKWSDFELGMSKYAQSFDSEEGFLNCLDDFNAFMHDYLKRIQKNYYENWNKINTHIHTVQEFSNSFEKLGRGVTHNLDNMLSRRRISNILNFGFISLNYTDVFDGLLDYSFGDGFHQKPIHVHGLLGDDPILGMDRIEQLNLRFNVSTKFKRHFIKPYFNSEYDTSRVEKAVKMINAANTVFVFGASLGESDLSWRELLIKWLQSNDNNHLFIYLHKNAIKTFNTVSERIDYEEEQQGILLKDWGISKDEIPMKQFHLPCSTNLFNIKSALNDDLIRQNKKV